MSCNGCRVLRKGCSENCILRPCLQWIESPEAQGHATVFVAKFFGRAGLMSFISAVPPNQRSSLFQSLLFEAAGRTVNPVYGAVGLLWTGNWHMCQAAVETVLRGGGLQPSPEFVTGSPKSQEAEDSSEAEVTCADVFKIPDRNPPPELQNRLRGCLGADLDLCLTQKLPAEGLSPVKRRSGTPSMNSEESVTTCLEAGFLNGRINEREQRLLNLFN